MTETIKYGLVTIAVLASIVVGTIVYMSTKADKIIYRAAKKIMANNLKKNYQRDALEIIITGSGGPMTNTVRGNPSIVAIADDKVYLFDAGSGTQKAMRWDGIPLGDLENIFLTHYHSDHIADLGEVRLNSWTSGRKVPIHVYGPAGLSTVIDGVEKFYSLDTGYRIAHHSEDVIKYDAAKFVPVEFTLPKEGELFKVYEEDDFKVYAFAVEHSPVRPAVGYRLKYKGKGVIYTGDITYQDYMVEPCKGADTILANGLDHELCDILGKAAKRAQKAGAKQLVLVHVTPPLKTKFQEKVYLRGVNDAFSGKVDIATDGMKIILK